MIYYKHPDSTVYAYETVDERDEFGPEDLVLMTDEEVDAHLHPQPTAETERTKRDGLLVALDSIVTNPLRWADFDDAQKAVLVAYRQALLDVPQQAAFPDRIDWPDTPAFID